MNELTEICRVASVDGWTLEQLRGCMNYGYAFKLTMVELIVIGIAAVLGMKVAVIGRKAPLAALEGLLLAPLAVYAGTTGGLIFAQWMPPWMMGVWLFFVAAAALVLLILGLINGTASGGWKALGAVELSVLAGGFVTAGVLCFMVPDNNAPAAYERYLDTVTWLFTVGALLDVLIAATYGSYHWGLGWLLVLVNASWGGLGNHLGIVHHTASWHLFNNQGQIRTDNRKFYTYYHDGLRLKNNFAFTQGAVMTGHPVETHESQHVLQHFIFGPIFTVSYLLWFIPASIIGLVVGLIAGKGIAGVEAWAYYNNPWEVWAYAAQGSRSQNGDTSLIWNTVASWIVSVVYYVIAVAVFIVLLVLRH
ncbi:MAG: hypothetical protein OEM00_01945 [Burkholderiaceae bacterium]|nr:hypothetical protein [Burkholderiaceae bacterium]